MNLLPGKGLIQASNVGAQASPQAAAAPWAALGDVGEVIAGLGEKGIALLNKHKELQVRQEAADMELDFENLREGYELEVLKNPNITPEQAVKGWQERVAPWQAKYQRDGMSQMETDVLTTRSKELAQRGGLGVLRASTIAGMQNAKQSAINLVTQGERSGNDEMRERGFEMLKSVMPEADIEAQRMASDGRVATNRVESAIAADPLGMRDKLKDPDFAKNTPGISVDDLPRLQDQARSLANRSIGDSVDGFEDDLATGKVKTPEDIERLYGNRVPPRVKEGMMGQLARRYDAEEQARIKSPEHQKAIIGKVSGLMEGLAGAEDFEDRYAEASFELDSLPDSPIKRRLKERLSETKSGRELAIKDHKDAAFKSLDVAYKAGRFRVGPKVEPQTMSLQKAVSDGLLMDKETLTKIGLSPDAVKAIASTESGAENQYGQKVKKRTLSESERINFFQQEFGKLPLDQRRLDEIDPLKKEALQAIIDGKGLSTTISYVSPEAEDAAISAQLESESKFGDAQMKLADFIETNPNATKEEIEERVLHYAGEDAYRELKSGIYDMKKQLSTDSPKGASDKTSAVPVGKNLTEIVKHFEASEAKGGFHRTAYWDYGQWSIGYGTKSKQGEVINEQEAAARLSGELASHRSRVEKAAAESGLRLNDHELDALTSFDYNTGSIRTLLKGGKRSKAEIADAMLLYRHAAGKRLRGLEDRRKAERELFLKGYSES